MEAPARLAEAPSSMSTAPRTVPVILIAGSTILSASLGIRQSFGLFLAPVSADGGITIGMLAFAIAVQNLVWGLAQPFAGAVADTRGAGRVAAAGGVLYAAGVVLFWADPSPLTALLGLGLMVGVGLGCTGFSVVMGAVGRAVPPAERSRMLGIASAGGSLGQILVVLMAQRLIDGAGAGVALLAVASVALLAPLAAVGVAGAPVTDGGPQVPLGRTVRAALGHRGFQLLTLGFFVCGLQLAFMGTHLPGFLATCHLPASLAAGALALIGAFNILGSWGCGQLGQRHRPKSVLAAVYLLRAVAILAFLALPKTPASVLAFSAAMGLLWLGTVPLTGAVIGQIFGPQAMGTLFGICFLSHQVGSFLGAWLGGVVFEATGSYDAMWLVTAAAGVAAALVHLPIDDRRRLPAAAPA